MDEELRLVPNLDGIICDVLREEFDVKCCEKGHYWFTDWEDHCRKVIRLYPLKSSSYPLYWGYNYDFIPWENCFLGVNYKPFNVTGKLVYHRTEKSVKIDFEGDAFPYIGYNFYSPSSHTPQEHLAFRDKYFVETCGNDSPENIEKIKAVVRRNIPFMLDWFERMKTNDDIIAALTEDIVGCEDEYCFLFGSHWVRGFLKARQHDIDGALSDIAYVYKRFDPPAEIPEKVIKKIYQIDKL